MSAETRTRDGWNELGRRAILDDHAVVTAALEELGHLEVAGDRAFRNRLSVHADLYTTHSIDLRRRYERGLPIIALSRCPFTDEPLEHSFDPYGLDGLWWDHDGPVRPVETVPHTFVGLTGALRLGGTLEHTPFLVKPGPEVPFVVPRLLEAGAVAVVTQVPVGRHTGYAVSYFAEQPLDVPLVDEWGRASHRRFRYGQAEAWDQRPVGDDASFDLRPWIEQERVMWVRPGDDELNLWSSTEDCPYLDLPGTRAPQRFQYGRAWHAGTGA